MLASLIVLQDKRLFLLTLVKHACKDVPDVLTRLWFANNVQTDSGSQMMAQTPQLFVKNLAHRDHSLIRQTLITQSW
jgi:hypothetical protein